MPFARDADFESCDDIQHLIAEQKLKPNSPAYAIARQAIALGIDSLSNRQRYVYDTVIAPALEALAAEERRGMSPMAA
jgi:hypothetical protein